MIRNDNSNVRFTFISSVGCLPFFALHLHIAGDDYFLLQRLQEIGQRCVAHVDCACTWQKKETN